MPRGLAVVVVRPCTLTGHPPYGARRRTQSPGPAREHAIGAMKAGNAERRYVRTEGARKLSSNVSAVSTESRGAFFRATRGWLNGARGEGLEAPSTKSNGAAIPRESFYAPVSGLLIEGHRPASPHASHRAALRRGLDRGRGLGILAQPADGARPEIGLSRETSSGVEGGRRSPALLRHGRRAGR